jgi:hypothetical protein
MFAFGVAAVSGRSLYLVGGTDGNTLFGTVWRAPIADDGTLGTFTALSAALTTPRGAHSVVVVGDSLYVLGGIAGPNAITSIERAPILADGSLGPFVAAGSLVDRRALFSVVSAGSYIYAIGGEDLGGVDPAACERATIDSSGALGGFASMADLHVARSGATTATFDDRLYVIGGGSTTIEVAAVHADGTIDPPALASSTLVTARANASTAIAWGFLYVIGGRDGTGAALGSLERATFGDDGTLGGFAVDGATTLVTPRHHHTSIVFGEAIYVIGGLDATGKTLGSVERVTIEPGGNLAPMQTVAGMTLATPRSGHATIVVGNSVYVLGGQGADGKPLASIEVATLNPDGTLSTFAQVGTLATPRTSFVATVVGDTIYVGGGTTTGGATAGFESAALHADGTLGIFAAVAGVSLATARSGAAATAVGNFVYVIGGANAGGTAMTSIERSSLH